MLFALLWTLLSGAFIGWLAGIIMHQPGSTLRNIIVGIAGSALGSALFAAVGFHAFGFPANLIVDVIGACALLMIVNWLAER